MYHISRKPLDNPPPFPREIDKAVTQWVKHFILRIVKMVPRFYYHCIQIIMQAELNWNSVGGFWVFLCFKFFRKGSSSFSICMDHSKQLRDLTELLTRRKIPSELYDEGLFLLHKCPACRLSAWQNTEWLRLTQGGSKQHIN